MIVFLPPFLVAGLGFAAIGGGYLAAATVRLVGDPILRLAPPALRLGTLVQAPSRSGLGLTPLPAAIAELRASTSNSGHHNNLQRPCDGDRRRSRCGLLMTKPEPCDTPIRLE